MMSTKCHSSIHRIVSQSAIYQICNCMTYVAQVHGRPCLGSKMHVSIHISNELQQAICFAPGQGRRMQAHAV